MVFLPYLTESVILLYCLQQKSEVGKKRSAEMEEESDDEPSSTRDESRDDNDDEEAHEVGSDEEESGSEKQSTKSPAKEKEKVSRRPKQTPNNEEIHAAAVHILKEVDFNSATLSDIIRKLGSHFGVDLMHKKVDVKAIITDVINNMSDEEEGDAPEAGDDEKNEGDDSDT